MKHARFLARIIWPLVFAAGLVAVAAAQETTGRFEGTLLVVWGDPPAGSTGGATRFTLALPDGTLYPLKIGAAQRNIAIQNFGKPVVIQGRKITGADGGPAVAVSRILPGVQGSLPDIAPALATKKALFILLRYRGDAQQPHDAQFFLDLTVPKTSVNKQIPATLNGFFGAASWNQLQWDADVAGVGGLNPTTWLTLPFPKSHYANCGSKGACANVFKIAADGMKVAARAGVHVTAYDAVNFVLNDDLDCCSWGGSFIYGKKVYHGTWEAPWGEDTSYYAHEMGHALGLPHSGWVYYSYDSPWDVMSMHVGVLRTPCGHYNSTNDGGRSKALDCWAPGDGYIAAHKDWLGWIPSANEVVINSKGSKTVTLEANGLPLRDGIKLIKICLAGATCSGGHAHYITVEARMNDTAYERGEPGSGILIQDFQADRKSIGGHCFFLNQSGWVLPIDATPNDYDKQKCSGGHRKWPNYALGNAEFTPGHKWNSAKLHVSVDVKSKTDTTYEVTVTRTQ